MFQTNDHDHVARAKREHPRHRTGQDTGSGPGSSRQSPSDRIALSLEIGDRECDAFCAAVEDFIASHRSFLSWI
jgi:hypothetical protein